MVVFLKILPKYLYLVSRRVSGQKGKFCSSLMILFFGEFYNTEIDTFNWLLGEPEFGEQRR